MRKSVLVTGATGALGKAAALEIARSGAKITLLGRNKNKLESVRNDISKETKNNDIEILVADLGHISSIKNAVKEFRQKNDKLDVLVNIAAVYHADRKLTKDKLEVMFATNHLGPFILTNGLLKLLKSSEHPRIINVSAPSTTKLKFDDLQGEKKFSALNAFGASKMMNILFTYSLSRRLDCTGITASVFHPGLMNSELINEMPGFFKFLVKLLAKKPEKAAKMLGRIAIDSEYAGTSGNFYKFNGDLINSSDYSHDTSVQDQLWQVSAQLAGKMS